MSDEIYEHLLYDGATHKSVASFSPGALRAHHHRPRLRQSLEHDRLAAGLAAPRPSRSPRPLTPSKATAPATRPPSRRKGAVAALTGPQDHLQDLAGRIRQAPHLRLEEAQQHPRHLLRERQRRVLPLPEHLRRPASSPPSSARKLLEAEKVAAVPGIAFGADDYLRISYATSMANIEKGLERIEKFVADSADQAIPCYAAYI